MQLFFGFVILISVIDLKILFKNVTKYDKKIYADFLKFHQKVFGLKYSTIIYGIATFFLSFGSMISPTLTKILVKEKSDYIYPNAGFRLQLKDLENVLTYCQYDSISSKCYVREDEDRYYL